MADSNVGVVRPGTKFRKGAKLEIRIHKSVAKISLHIFHIKLSANIINSENNGRWGFCYCCGTVLTVDRRCLYLSLPLYISPGKRCYS